MKIAIEHSTVWHTEALRSGISTQLLRLTPRDSARQHVVSWELSLPCHATRGTDPFGNVHHVLSVETPRRDLTLTARGVVEIRPNAVDADDDLNPLLFLRATGLTQADTPIAEFADNFRATHMSREILRALMIGVADHVHPADSTQFGGASAAEVFARRSGTCHDMTHVFLACARHVGVPARFVSGYVHSPGRDQVASHAWAEAHVGGHWHTFDIAGRLDRPTTHLKLAIGMDYLDTCPVRGVRVGSARERLTSQALVDQAMTPNQ